MVKFLLEIITPQRRVFSEEVDSVNVPTPRGTVGVLAHHTSLFSSLVEGEIKIASSGKDYFLAIGGGFMEVGKGQVSILVSRAFHADELNEAEIKRARDAAAEAIKTGVKGQERAAAQAILRRSLLEERVFKKRKYRPS
ncbi:MAG: ATP synthase epsilon chain [Candidatus Gottesmanbacteria bacterium GW2011_GWA2_47_9]|uniref:ATP synthase epsilon chain n=1 Tax=Candidatus Gottesmanbacteria bacterium GW2011_GWA2_47_9 TaxID=1618445 RepID=A0A0G1WYZ5_9BACT|nr:MAG: ATP synthase epsilon chain [Candidatus Gottesmanbacteria bacterium GW2011_GWA2_47_9]